LAESLIQEIYKQFTQTSRSRFVQKKAGLTLLRLYRKFPDIFPVREWAQGIIKVMDDKNVGVVHAATCLILALSQNDPEAYVPCVTKAITKLSSVTKFK
jgi:AP-2 complex subunit alpha